MSKWVKRAIGMAIAIGIFIAGVAILNPLDKSTNVAAFYDAHPDAGPDAEMWGRAGSYFQWQSTQPENSDQPVQNVFYRTFGNIENPAIVMVHGWPTSSYDFKDLIRELEGEYYIAVIDTPGYGFSDKPKASYRYSIPDDVALLDHFVRKILQVSKFTLLTHDKGDSVGFAFLTLYQQDVSPVYEIEHHVILNGGIYLPLAELSVAQKYFTIPIFGQFVTRFVFTPDVFTRGMADIYLPELTPQEQANMSSIFRYQGGTTVFPNTLRYLDDRRELETVWLQTLQQSEIPATLIWGEQDPIAKTQIADFVWENYLRDRSAPASYWRLPCAGHYLQNDQPKAIADLVRQSLSGVRATFAEAGNPECVPIPVQAFQAN